MKMSCWKQYRSSIFVSRADGDVFKKYVAVQTVAQCECLTLKALLLPFQATGWRCVFYDAFKWCHFQSLRKSLSCKRAAKRRTEVYWFHLKIFSCQQGLKWKYLLSWPKL